MNIKKFIATTITSPIIGLIVGKYFNHVNYYGSRVDMQNPNLSNESKAKIFWNLYESAEARLISKYLRKDLPVIELGASLGIISKLISDRIEMMLVCVEANISLIPSIRYNLQHLPQERWSVIHSGLSYASTPIRFTGGMDNNLTGRVDQSKGEIVPSITVGDILDQYDIKEYSLVCDIEGSEVEIFQMDSKSLKSCQWIIIELHETKFKERVYGVDDLCKIIEDLGFVIEERDGNCFAFRRLELQELEIDLDEN